MTRVGRRLALIVVGIAFVAVGLLAAFQAMAGRPSQIVDFKPTVFPAKADAEFFYSIGDELKHAGEIDPKAPTLLRGEISRFLVAPDNQKIAVVADGQLLIVGTESILRQVTAVDPVYTYNKPKPIGKQFFRDNYFQWSKDSKALYLIHDEYYESKGAQLYSTKGELWKYDLETASLEVVIKPFQAYHYFFDARNGIYLSTVGPDGALQLRYFNGIIATDLSRTTIGAPFFSFPPFEYEQVLRLHGGVELKVEGQDKQQMLLIRGKAYLALTLGQDPEGFYYGSEMSQSVFLPGDRYFLFNTRCGNFRGQLLIDTQSGQYQRLPTDSAVYLTLNTDTNRYFGINAGGIFVR
jgi:hypothetical protein